MEDIFQVTVDGQLRQFSSAPYQSEDLLQRLLAAHPDVLASGAGSPRLMLVAREVAVAEQEGGPGRWSLDHLFVDADGVPVLVEVKRASDTRLRRETVGQLLDYAAHGATYWSASELRDGFEASCRDRGTPPDDALLELVGPDGDLDDFWTQVENNLRAGRVRIVLVADDIPRPVRHVLEFLNEQMSPAEVFAVEVRQYLGDGPDRTLVPRLIGRTRRAERNRAATAPSRSRPWTLDELLSDLRTRGTDHLVAVVRRLHDEIAARTRLVFNRGSGYGSFVAEAQGPQGNVHLLLVRSTGQLMVPLSWLQSQPPFDDEALRDEYRSRIEQAVPLPPDMEGQPYVSLDTLADEAAFTRLVEALEWALDQTRSSRVGH